MNQVEEEAPAKSHVFAGPPRGRSATLRMALASAAVTGMLAAMPSPAEATPQVRCGVSEVPEYSGGVVVQTLKPWESLTVTPGGRIWAGVWFTGENGPEGWSSIAPSGHPLPGARSYSLVGRVSGQPWRYIGSNATTFRNKTPYSQYLYARVNDNQPGNGSGAFSVTACYYF